MLNPGKVVLMTISRYTYRLIQEIVDARVLPDLPHVIEFGESNWYGDVPYHRLELDIDKYVSTQELGTKLKVKLNRCIQQLSEPKPDYEALWDLAKIFYKTFLDYESYTAIDLSGSPAALRLDLNKPVSLERQFDIAINFGTAEHVFNVYQVFKTIHEVTLPRGIIINSMPFQGWIDHGFFNFQPTFYYDLAAANNYQLPLLIYAQSTSPDMIQIRNQEHVTELIEQGIFQGNGTLYAVFLKPAQENPFRAPMQGYYEGSVSTAVKAAWQNNR